MISAIKTVLSVAIPGPSYRLDIVTFPGYAHAGQYQSMLSFTPSLRKDGLNHNILVLLNYFRIVLLGNAIGREKNQHEATY